MARPLRFERDMASIEVPSKPALDAPVAAAPDAGGIRIRVDASWWIIAGLIVFALFQFFRAGYPDHPAALHWGAAILGAMFFFASILVHEAAHSTVAVQLGLPVHDITLFVFGGVSRMGGEPRRPRDEFLIAVVGPMTSLAIGAALLAVGMLMPAAWLTGGVLRWLGAANLGLGIFNLAPGFPLDGGRILRSAVWAWSGDFRRATAAACTAGAGFAYAVMGLGAYLFVAYGLLFNAIWLGLLGWFLLTAVEASRRQMTNADVLGRLTVGQAMRAPFGDVPGGLSVSALVEERVLREGERCFFVVEDGRLEGLVTLHEIRATPRDEWPIATARAVMVPLAKLRTVGPGEPLLRAVEKMDEAGVNQIPVVDGASLLGVVTREDIVRRLAMHVELEGGAP